MKINKTADYSKFKSDSSNREVRDTRRVQKIAASMEKYGWIPSFPINVKKDGPCYVVRDGQHRLEAAKLLGIEVLFVVDSTDIDIAEVNNTQRNWSIADYVTSYAARGYSHYHYLNEFSKRTGLGHATSAGLLYGHIGCSNVRDSLLSGEFVVRDTVYAERVFEVYSKTADIARLSNRKAYILAISRACRVESFDYERYISAIVARPGSIRNMPDSDGFLAEMEAAYNRHQREKVALVAMVNAEMDKRNARNKKKK